MKVSYKGNGYETTITWYSKFALLNYEITFNVIKEPDVIEENFE